ncbi:MAG TPA: serine/threonine-protein kinase [Thermoanaerobaculia bacterium]|nr:serine/threonine-protein kinase [Thermoanaerobaculia bacterium]
MTSLRPAVIRLFCICCALVVLPLAPMAIGTIATMRVHPLPFPARDAGVVAIRFGNAPFVAAASPEARRRFRNAPVGSEIAYRLRDGRIVRGPVRNVAADRATLVRRAVLALLALVSLVAGLALGLAGQNRAALHAGGFLAGAGATLGFGFLEPNLVLIDSRALRDAIIVLYALVPAALWCRYLLLLAADLPHALPIGRVMRAILGAVSFLAIARSILFAWSQIGVLFDRVPGATAIASLVEGALLQSVPYLATVVAALLLVVRQLRTRGAAEMRDRARLVALGLLLGIGIPLAGMLVQFLSLAVTSRLAMPRELMALLLLPLLLVPLSLAYALLARRVERAGVLTRRAVVFAVADRTLLAVMLVVVAVLLVTRSFLALLAIALIALARLARRSLERTFLRDTADARRVLHDFTQRVHSVTTTEALARDVAETLTAALRLESATLVTPEPSWRMSTIDAIADVDARFLATLSTIERQWLEQRQIRLLVPAGSAVLAAGEKMSGLPFDENDRLLAGTIGSATALALETIRLREARPAPVVLDDPELARICPACARVTDPLAATRCAQDDMPLVAANVPHVLHAKFRFERRIGSGAMGVVYQVRDLALGRDIAVKMLPAVGADAIARFEREAHAAAALSHPSIATIHAADSWRGQPLLLFELLDGGTLAERLERGPLAAGEVLRIGIALCDALAHAHAAGVLHRDVKPSNIGFDRNDTPKLLDFGLAAFARETGTTNIAGTPRYLAPEVAIGEVASPAADVWSIGVTLYEALTGANPFAAGTAVLTMNRILGEDVADPRTLQPLVPAALADVLLTSLRRAPRDRFASAAAMRDALRNCGGTA